MGQNLFPKKLWGFGHHFIIVEETIKMLRKMAVSVIFKSQCLWARTVAVKYNFHESYTTIISQQNVHKFGPKLLGMVLKSKGILFGLLGMGSQLVCFMRLGCVLCL